MGDSSRLCEITGMYRAVCCKVEVRVVAGRTFPPCPICGRLTIWVLAKKPERRVA